MPTILTAVSDNVDKLCSGVARILAEGLTAITKILSEGITKILSEGCTGITKILSEGITKILSEGITKILSEGCTGITKILSEGCIGITKILSEGCTGITKILSEVREIEITIILVELGKPLAEVWKGAADIFAKLKPFIDVLAAYHVLPQILALLCFRTVFHHYHPNN